MAQFAPVLVKPVTAGDVLIAYGFKAIQRFIDEMAGVDTEVLTLARDLAPVWAPILVPGKYPNVVVEWVRFLEGAGPRCHVMLESLRKINFMLVELDSVVNGNKLKSPIRELSLLVTNERWVLFSDAIFRLDATKLVHIKAFLQTRNRETHVQLLESCFHLCCSPVVVHGTLALDAIALVMDKLGRSDNVGELCIVDLALMCRFKIRGDFPGFAAWGPGDHGNPLANIDGHFDKHVLGIGADVRYRLDEMVEWWRTLNLRLTLDEYNQNTHNIKAAAQQLFGQDAVLPAVQFMAFALLDPMNGEAAFCNLMRAKMKNLYRDLAIDQSQHLTDCCVHGTDKKVYLSGCIRGTRLFIIGRFEGNVLGISASYFVPQAELDGKLNDRVPFWKLL
jgi:hypothetical protein